MPSRHTAASLQALPSRRSLEVAAHDFHALRSLIDVAASNPDDEQLGRAIAEAQQSGLLTLRALRARAETVDVRAALYIERAISASASATVASP